MVKLSETLRARSTVYGLPDASGNVTPETSLIVVRQQLMLFQDLLAVLARPTVFPYHMGERAALVLVQAVEDRLRTTTPDTEMDTEEGTAELFSAIDKVLYGFLRIVKNQRAGRAGGSVWSKLLSSVETQLGVQDGTRENVSVSLAQLKTLP